MKASGLNTLMACFLLEAARRSCAGPGDQSHKKSLAKARQYLPVNTMPNRPIIRPTIKQEPHKENAKRPTSLIISR